MAIVLGVLALRQIRREPQQKGKRLAMAGIVLGLGGLVGLVMWIVLLPDSGT